MGPVTPIGSGASQASQAPLAASATGAAEPAVGGAVVAASSELSSSITITNVQASVGGFLEGIDSELADNEMLRMLIALMILMALLQNGQSGNEGDASAMEGLGSGGGASQMLGAFVSSTTIQMEQSVSTSLVIGTFEASEGDAQDPGSRIDISA